MRLPKKGGDIMIPTWVVILGVVVVGLAACIIAVKVGTKSQA
jgi:hypothetical protein